MSCHNYSYIVDGDSNINEKNTFSYSDYDRMSDAISIYTDFSNVPSLSDEFANEFEENNPEVANPNNVLIMLFVIVICLLRA